MCVFECVKYLKPIVILVLGNSHRTGSWVLICAAGGLGWTPQQQVDQYGDDADGEEGEDGHQAVGSVLHRKLFTGAVVEVQRVNVQEKLLRVGVWIKTAADLRHSLQTVGQDVVRSGRKFSKDGKEC